MKLTLKQLKTRCGKGAPLYDVWRTLVVDAFDFLETVYGHAAILKKKGSLSAEEKELYVRRQNQFVRARSAFLHLCSQSQLEVDDSAFTPLDVVNALRLSKNN
jgi:hypothetical protein